MSNAHCCVCVCVCSRRPQLKSVRSSLRIQHGSRTRKGEGHDCHEGSEEGQEESGTTTCISPSDESHEGYEAGALYVLFFRAARRGPRRAKRNSCIRIRFSMRVAARVAQNETVV